MARATEASPVPRQLFLPVIACSRCSMQRVAQWTLALSHTRCTSCGHVGHRLVPLGAPLLEGAR